MRIKTIHVAEFLLIISTLGFLYLGRIDWFTVGLFGVVLADGARIASY